MYHVTSESVQLSICQCLWQVGILERSNLETLVRIEGEIPALRYRIPCWSWSQEYKGENVPGRLHELCSLSC